VLYAQVGPEVRVEDVDHITGREHVGVTSGQVLVDDDPVAGLQAGCLGQLGVGNDTRPDDDRLGVDRAGIGYTDPDGCVVLADDLPSITMTSQPAARAVAAVSWTSNRSIVSPGPGPTSRKSSPREREPMTHGKSSSLR